MGSAYPVAIDDTEIVCSRSIPRNRGAMDRSAWCAVTHRGASGDGLVKLDNGDRKRL